METLTALRSRFRYWLDKRLCQNVYRLVDDTIIKNRGRGPQERITLTAIVWWQVDYEMVFDIVQINHGNGDTLAWLDYHNDLLSILRTNLREKERKPISATAQASSCHGLCEA